MGELWNNETKLFLDEKVDQYNGTDFIESDPISIPHQFTKKEDVEIAGLLAATIAWGQRKTIINNANKMMEFMDNSPHDFVMNHISSDLVPLRKFKHRTFNGDDFCYFITQLQRIYRFHGGIESCFKKEITSNSKDMAMAIESFRTIFFDQVTDDNKRTMKHVSSPLKGSAAKRLIMYLRWMVRKDSKGVDFGIWNTIKPADLICPLDVHVDRIARRYNLLERKQSDWKSALELTNNLRKFDPTDPVKYDFALFGIGIDEKANPLGR